MDRAEYIKKQVLTTSANQVAPKDEPDSPAGDGTSATKAKPKTK